jgi:hypothetical protein
LPLMYDIASLLFKTVYRYPLNTRMDATSRTSSTDGTIPTSTFEAHEHLRCMSQISPIVIGVSKVARLLSLSDSLTRYNGGRLRRRAQKAEKSSDRVIHRLHSLRPVEHKGDALNTRVGLGRGWEKMYQGIPVDSPRRKFKM